MSKNQSAVYAPYGAYELKATYQRNMLLSSLTVNGLIVAITVAVILIVDSVTPNVVYITPDKNETRKEIRPQPNISRDTPGPNVRPPKTEKPGTGIFVPVEDEKFLEDDTVPATFDADPNESDSGDSIANGEPSEFDYDDGFGKMPGLDEFIPNVQNPEFIYKAIPEYPRFEKQAGIEGTVWIAVEVDIDGSVTDAKVYKSSERTSFDQAALAVAFENKFRPAIQNGYPRKLWTAYKVEFVLNR